MPARSIPIRLRLSQQKVVNLWRKAHFTPWTKIYLMSFFAWMRGDEAGVGRDLLIPMLAQRAA